MSRVRPRIVLMLALLSLNMQARAQQIGGATPAGSAQNCVEQLGALAARQHRDATGLDTPPISANSPSNVTGQFNESATRNRLGNAFGHSVTPERPSYAPPATAIPRSAAKP